MKNHYCFLFLSLNIYIYIYKYIKHIKYNKLFPSSDNETFISCKYIFQEKVKKTNLIYKYIHSILHLYDYVNL